MYSSEVIHLRRRFGQWKEDHKENPPDLEFYEYVEALKLTGDRYVPAGEVKKLSLGFFVAISGAEDS